MMWDLFLIGQWKEAVLFKTLYAKIAPCINQRFESVPPFGGAHFGGGITLFGNGSAKDPYVWNDEQTEAFYDVAGNVKKISYINASGKRINIDYIIPNKNQCKGCHIRGDKMQPIGPTATQLNRDYTYPTGKQNQLSYWQHHGLLNGLPALQTIDKFPSRPSRQSIFRIGRGRLLV